MDLLIEIAQQLRPILQRYHVQRAIVFGSLARGDASRHSDLDLIIVQETPQRFVDRYTELLPAIAMTIRHRDVDLLIYTPRELAMLADRPFIARALREGITIYESDQEPTRSPTLA